MQDVINLTNLVKVYKNQKVVDIKNLVIKKNSIYGLIGPNGAGKSTTMKMICGLTKATSGSIVVNKITMNDKNRIKILSQIGSLIETPSYYENLTGFENLEIVSKYKQLKNSDILEVLQIVGLLSNKDKLVKKYSLGMKQRLGIAMALIGYPKLMILDEPTNGLDPQAMEDIRNLIKSLPNKFDTTIMISSHALDEIEKMADHIGIIGKGKILYQGEIKSFKAKFKGEIHFKTSANEKATVLLERFNPRLNDETISFGYMNDEKIAQIGRLLYKNNIDSYRIYEEINSLEKIFLDFTKNEQL
ncbi:ABC-2 type transport system ATP-binding protein [Peptoniphilus olsenii]|uniref:ABC-2 type transport system ATP-binding protein n=1 Tax=Peptoniphilus olsenii TaxID=411570 RepID=A0ABV2JC19_9FIRM